MEEYYIGNLRPTVLQKKASSEATPIQSTKETNHSIIFSALLFLTILSMIGLFYLNKLFNKNTHK